MTDKNNTLHLEKKLSNKRSRTRSKNRAKTRNRIKASTSAFGGRTKVLDQKSVLEIHKTVVNILETIGVATSSLLVQEIFLENGGVVSKDNRILIPENLLNKALQESQKNVTLFGQSSTNDLILEKNRVYVGTGGAAPLILDPNNFHYRSSTLEDLYNAARIVDNLDNIHFFSRPLVATDIDDNLDLDINTTFASLLGTKKHVMVSATSAESVVNIAKICHIIAGSEEKFSERPFLSLNVNHIIPPLKFSEESCKIIIEAAKFNIPIQMNTFGQLGASSPVTIAGCVAQTIAETLAGLVFAWIVNPQIKTVFGPRPMITDLRTGAMAGGCGEQAILTAATIQMANFYGLSNSTIAGASDSKTNDAQSGFEKSITVMSAAQAGCNLITQAAGMHAGLMGCSLESYFIDNDMLGNILRTLMPIEISPNSLAMESINEAVHHTGHFLSDLQTLERMETDFLYPEISNRDSIETWQSTGRNDILKLSNSKVKQVLANYKPNHIGSEKEEEIRRSFKILLKMEVK